MAEAGQFDRVVGQELYFAGNVAGHLAGEKGNRLPVDVFKRVFDHHGAHFRHKTGNDEHGGFRHQHSRQHDRRQPEGVNIQLLPRHAAFRRGGNGFVNLGQIPGTDRFGNLPDDDQKTDQQKRPFEYFDIMPDETGGCFFHFYKLKIDSWRRMYYYAKQSQYYHKGPQNGNTILHRCRKAGFL